MSDATHRHDPGDWEHRPPDEVLTLLVYELYNPVSLLSQQLRRLTEDDDPLTEEDYEAIFDRMHGAVRQLSKTVVHLKQYTQKTPPTKG